MCGNLYKVGETLSYIVVVSLGVKRWCCGLDTNYYTVRFSDRIQTAKILDFFVGILGRSVNMRSSLGRNSDIVEYVVALLQCLKKRNDCSRRKRNPIHHIETALFCGNCQFFKLKLLNFDNCRSFKKIERFQQLYF